jgi:hypothetical protein
MAIVMVTHTVNKVAFYFSALSAIRRLLKGQHGYSHKQKQGFEWEGERCEKQKMEKESRHALGIWYCQFYNTSYLEKPNQNSLCV